MSRLQVLDMEPLPKLKHTTGPWKFPRKRRRSNTDTEADTPNGNNFLTCSGLFYSMSNDYKTHE